MVMIVAFVFLLSFSAVIQAADAKPSDKKSDTKVRQVTGEVTELDLKAQTVTVRSKNGTVAIGLTERTRVMKDKEAKSLSDVQIGDRVTVKYRQSEGRQTAKSLEIKSASRKAKIPT